MRLLLLLSILLAGCASTREFANRHPVATGIGVALVAGSIAVAAQNHGDHRDPQEPSVVGPKPLCYPQPNGSCR